MTIECFGTWGECLMEVPDGVNEDVLYWKITCLKRDDCYFEWQKSGKQVKDMKLLEGAK